MWKCTTLGEMERKARLLDEQGIPHPGILIGSLWGEPTASNFLEILKYLPEGDAEILVHLGSFTRQAPYPSGLDVFYFENRELELITITSLFWEEYFNYLNIKRIGYSDLRKFCSSNLSHSEDCERQKFRLQQGLSLKPWHLAKK